MSSTCFDYQRMFGTINPEMTAMPKCACVPCNACTCACSCRVDSFSDLDWEDM